MSSHASTKIDQKEYLKKYLSGDKVKKKKKDKKHKKEAKAKVKIIDDDASAFPADHEIDEELLLGGEDAPQIVGEYIEERANLPKWRSITVKEEPLDDEQNALAVKVKQEPSESDLWGRKASTSTKNKNDFSPARKNHKRKHTPDKSPPRRRRDQTDRLHYDQSPPRKNVRSPASSKRKGRSADHQPMDDSDESPPRKSRRSPGKSKRRSRSADRSPVCRRRKEASPRNSHTQRGCSRSSDQSPPRQQRKNVNSDQSPPRRHRKGIDSDQSPPRRRPKSVDSDQSPPRRRRKSTDSDQSPPRRSRKGADSDQSPPRRRRKSADSDQSPPRRRDKEKPRKRTPPQYRRDQSPPRKRMPSIPSTRIKREKRSREQSPPPKTTSIKHERSVTPPRRSRWEQHNSDSPPPTHKPKATKTLDGKKAGLQDAQALKAETEERRRQEDRLYSRMSGDVSGRDAEVQVRSTGRRGRRARDAQAEDPEVQRRKEEREKQKKELYDRWGKGLKQIEAHRERLQEQEYESNKPLARYSNDADLDRHLREQERADDPMLQYMRQKRKERQTERNVPTMPVYEGSFPENRFGIRPGYRWDGVDRSNGYEKRWFDKQNEQRAVQDEAYKYSVEDM